MKNFIKDLFTEVDGQSFDVTIVMGVGSIVVMWAMLIYSVGWLHKDFDMNNFAIGTAAIIAATGAGARLKPQASVDK